MQCYLFIDSEGVPTQELSAILLSVEDSHIVDIYHEHAQVNLPYDPDRWSRHHVHGLNRDFLKSNGFQNEEALINHFKSWLEGKKIKEIYANDPLKENKMFIEDLGIGPITDVEYPPWKKRVHLLSHKTAFRYKESALPITSLKSYVSCTKYVHNEFLYIPTPHQTLTQIAKRNFGYHCSLYDAFSLCLNFLIDVPLLDIPDNADQESFYE